MDVTPPSAREVGVDRRETGEVSGSRLGANASRFRAWVGRGAAQALLLLTEGRDL